jgi:hypothetical protein
VAESCQQTGHTLLNQKESLHHETAYKTG